MLRDGDVMAGRLGSVACGVAFVTAFLGTEGGDAGRFRGRQRKGGQRETSLTANQLQSVVDVTDADYAAVADDGRRLRQVVVGAGQRVGGRRAALDAAGAGSRADEGVREVAFLVRRYFHSDVL